MLMRDEKDPEITIAKMTNRMIAVVLIGRVEIVIENIEEKTDSEGIDMLTHLSDLISFNYINALNFLDKSYILLLCRSLL